MAPATAVEMAVELPKASFLECAFKCDFDSLMRLDGGGFGNLRISLAVIDGSCKFIIEPVSSDIAIRLLERRSSDFIDVRLVFSKLLMRFRPEPNRYLILEGFYGLDWN